MIRRSAPLSILGVAIGLLTGAQRAAADAPGSWPVFRHDLQRTARATVAGAIKSPAVAWSLPVGGTLSAAQVAVNDLDGDGRRELILASGGAVVVRRSDDTVVWRSALFGADQIYGIWNLDNAGPPEIVAHGASPRGIYLLDGATGSIKARLPVSSVLVGVTPVPHGGGYDLAVREDASNWTVSLYATSSGLAQKGAAWSSTLDDYNVDPTLAVGDLDGDGIPEIVAPNARGFVALDPATGNILYRADVLADPKATPVYYFGFVLADVDGRPGDEIIALDASYYYSADASLSVLGVRNGQLQVLWQRYDANQNGAGPGQNVGLQFFMLLAEGVADLDGDGKPEIVYAAWDGRVGPGSFTTHVADAATGADLAVKAGIVPEAVADIDGDGRPEIVYRLATDANPVGNVPTPLFATLRCFDFDSPGAGLADKGWSLDNAAVATLPAWRAPRRPLDPGSSSSSTLLVSAFQDIDAPGVDPANELYVYLNLKSEFVNQERPSDLVAVHGADGKIVEDYTMPTDSFAAVVALGNGIASAAARAEALLAVNDGRARLLSPQFAETGAVTEGNYAELPAALSLDGHSILVAAVRSLGQLELLDGTRYLGARPVVVATSSGVIQSSSRGYVNSPGVVLPLPPPSTSAQLVVRAHSHTDWQDDALVAIDATGTERFRAEVGHRRSIEGFENFAGADWNGDGTTDLFATESSDSGTEELVVHSGKDGSLIRSLPVGPLLSASGEMVSAGAYLQGHALVDVNGDGVPDLVAALHPQWLAAIDLGHSPIAPIWVHQSNSQNGQIVNGQAMVAAMAADAAPRILRVNSQNAFGPYLRFTLDGTKDGDVLPVAVRGGVPSADANTAAFIARPGAPGRFDFVTAGMTGAATGLVVRYDGVTMQPVLQKYLGGGMVQDTPPAQPAALYDPIVADVNGDGSDDIIVGSDDGWLYALRGDTGALTFALDLGAPVVHVIAANLDQDPAIELLCARLDGTLAAVDQQGGYSWTAAPMPEMDAGIVGDMGASDLSTPGDANSVGAKGGGCGCRVAGSSGRPVFSVAAIILLAVGIRSRSRSRQRSRSVRQAKPGRGGRMKDR
jgi:hypothetical protein